MVIANCVSWEPVVGLFAVGQLLNSILCHYREKLACLLLKSHHMIRSFNTLSHASWPNYRKHFSVIYMPHTGLSNPMFHESVRATINTIHAAP